MIIDATATHAGTLTPPPSKSDAQRALVLGHILGIELAVDEYAPGDVRALSRGLAMLRANDRSPIDVGDGGAPLRLLMGQAAITDGVWTITGSKRLAERPHGALIEALGSVVKRAPFPLVIHGGAKIAVPRFVVRTEESSQFATSLLFAAAALALREQRAWTVELVGPKASEGYLQLTLAWMKRAGLVTRSDGNAITVEPTRGPIGSLAIPGDWSSIGYLLPIAWKTGAIVTHVDRDAAHPDRAILDLLAQCGLTFDGRVTGIANAGITASGAVCPDLLPTAAVLACALPAPSLLTDVAILRHKESDRVRGIEELVVAGGGRFVHEGDRVTIEPGTIPPRLAISSRGDHRIAMAATTLAILGGATLELDDPRVVDKSFPRFFEELANVGVSASR